MRSKSSPFAVTGAARVQRSAFDLTHVVKTAFYPGQLIPLPPIECIPGDIHKIRFNGVMRLQPLATPVFENMKLRFYSFFVPFRILWDQWEDFITRGREGTTVVSIPTVNPADFQDPTGASDLGSLWDYFGWQIGDFSTGLTANSRPIDFPYRAYWAIWNEYFRIPSIQDEVDWNDYTTDALLAQPAWRNWQRDYFTSALPEAQLGVPPALPVFGTANAEFDFGYDPTGADGEEIRLMGLDNSGSKTDASFVRGQIGAGLPRPVQFINDLSLALEFNDLFTNKNSIDGSTFSSSDINDLRLTWQLQVWQERNARAGSRYVEQLMSHYRVSPLDARLQRPEFIGGSTTDVLISEVVQTSESDTTDQGNLAGKGISLPTGHVGSYRVEEHGLIMNIVCVTPQATYQQGIPRNWLRRTTFDYPFPEFAHLGEQSIYNAELYIANSAVDDDPFGFTGIYNEMRYLQNKVTGQMRSGVTGSLDNWHMARDFASTPPLATQLTSMEYSLPDMMRPFAVTNQPPLLGIFSVGLDSLRPLPFIAEPSAIGG